MTKIVEGGQHETIQKETQIEWPQIIKTRTSKE